MTFKPAAGGVGPTGPLVLKQDRSSGGSSSKKSAAGETEPSGEAESLWGRINPKEMGSKFQPTKAPSIIGADFSSSAPAASRSTRKQRSTVKTALPSTSEFAGLTYRPRSQETRVLYDAILALVRQVLGDQPSQLLRSATDDLVIVLKEDASAVTAEKLAQMIGAPMIPMETFSQLCSLVSRLDDYSAASSAIEGSNMQASAAEQVAVLFEGSSSSSSSEESYPGDAFASIDPHEPDEEEGSDVVDLDRLAFTEGGRLMSNRKCILPDGTEKILRDGYEEIHVPAPAPPAQNTSLLPISSLPTWTHPAFTGTDSLNRIQSQVAPLALESDGNLLICAPTGAGKTNIALLALLRLLHTNPAARAIYIAPMKALVQEMVTTFARKLEPYERAVAEMTGDQTLTRQQIADTFLIVTTPEKYDIITRKVNAKNDYTDGTGSFTDSVKLVIIDEVHLLHDERGPALESLIARLSYAPDIRLIALSATLPNYHDVARVLRVPAEGVFYFDASFRPCPLAMQYVGLHEKKPTKRLHLMDKIVYEKVVERAQNYQVLIFVHSRKEAARTARCILQSATEHNTLSLFKPTSSVLVEEMNEQPISNSDLKQLLPCGFGIHHAGLNRSDRSLVERLFALGRFPVLVSTATLAWGVNLPAHTVIIKGTQLYSPEKGKWTELSPQDTLQMLGRAGRPQYDLQGEGIILTSAPEMHFYLSLTNMQLPIESQLVGKLVDCLNAEVVTGRVVDLGSAADWLERTYLSVRMAADPVLYGCPTNQDTLARKRLLLHSACALLDKGGLANYDARTGAIEATPLGRTAAHFYLSHRTVSKFAGALKPHLTDMELLRTFCLADEFRNVPVRAEEKLEVAKLIERVPVPIRESPDDPLAKLNALLQCHISRVQIEGLALTADLVYIAGSAGRLMRALYEICLQRGWAKAAHLALDYCRVVERRQWRVQTPLRQMSAMVGEETLRRLERKDFFFPRLFDLDASELSELVRQPTAGPTLKEALSKFPLFTVAARPLPRRHDLLELAVDITPRVTFDYELHGTAIPVQVFIEDTNRDIILAHTAVSIKPRHCSQGRLPTMHFCVPLGNPVPPVFFVSVVAEHWLGAERTLPVNLLRLTVPTAEPAPTPVLDIRPVPVSKFLPGRPGYLSVPLSQASALFSKSAVYATGNPQDYEMALTILRSIHPDALYDASILQAAQERNSSGKYIFTKFDYESELCLLSLLLNNDEAQRPFVFVLLESAVNAQLIAEWIGAQAVVNFTPPTHLPVESQLDAHYVDFLNHFIAAGHASTLDECVNVLSRTFLYRRLLCNPFYYGASGGDLSLFLSQVVQENCACLAEAECIQLSANSAQLSPLPLGHVAAHYHVQCATVEMFSLSLTASSALRNVFDILTAAEEFADFDLLGEEQARELYQEAPMRIPSVRFHDPHHAVHIYLQAYLSRALPTAPSSAFLDVCLRLVRALVDVAAVHSYSTPILASIQLLQLLHVRQWPQQGPLYQLHYSFPPSIQHPFDLLDLSPEQFTSFCTEHRFDSHVLGATLRQLPDITVEIMPSSSDDANVVSFALTNKSHADQPLYCVLLDEQQQLCALKQLSLSPLAVNLSVELEVDVDHAPCKLLVMPIAHFGFDYEFALDY